MPDYSDLNPANLKPGLVSGSGLKPGLVTPSYSGGTPAAAGQIKPSLRRADGTLKPGLISGDSLKPSLSAAATTPTSLSGVMTYDDDAITYDDLAMTFEA